MNKAIFLDRDGVINMDYGYVHEIKNFKFMPESAKALKKLSEEKDYKIIIITNQSGIGRGYYTLKDYKQVTSFMLEQLGKNKIKIDKIYFCPHHPNDDCNCRKPKTKFLLDAQKEFNIDLNKSYMVGNKTTDIKFGKDGGCKTILIKAEEQKGDNLYNVRSDFIAKDLYNAVEIILGEEK